MSHSTFRCWKRDELCSGRIYAFDLQGAQATVQACPRRTSGDCYIHQLTSPFRFGNGQVQETDSDRFLLWLKGRKAQAS